MLEYFDGGKRWMRGALRDASGEHRCLIGALRDVRQGQQIREAGAEFCLRAALLSTLDELDPFIGDAMARLCGHREPGVLPDLDLMTCNDGGDSYDEVRKLIVEAREIAQAELDAASDHQRSSTLTQLQSTVYHSINTRSAILTHR
jgi:hypothetical protein